MIVALITTAGLRLDDQPPSDLTRIRASDHLSRIRAHPPFANQDLNCVFPLALLANPAPVHYSFSPLALLDETAPRVARELEADAVVIAPS